MCRTVCLVLCDRSGALLGAMPPFEVTTPWWPDAEPVVAAARDRFGLDVVILRLLTAEPGPGYMGGRVSYLAEVRGAVPAGFDDVLMPAADVESATSGSALRAPWGRPGGVAALVAWADAALAELGRPRIGRAVQVKSWNLSSVLRLPTAPGPVWCKTTPAMLGDEGAAIALVAAEDPQLVPRVLARNPAARTVLLDDVPGADQADAGEELLLEMVRRLVDLQARWAGRAEEMFRAGFRDWRGPALLERAGELIRRPAVRAQLTADEVAELADFISGELPRRLAELAECGLPDTLVHGDASPLNWRCGPAGLRLLDWAEAGVGSPALDRGSFAHRGSAEVQRRVRAAWDRAWLRHRPGSDPARAGALIAPIACLRAAIVYSNFIDGIEPSEYPYHVDDVPRGLRNTLRERAIPIT